MDIRVVLFFLSRLSFAMVAAFIMPFVLALYMGEDTAAGAFLGSMICSLTSWIVLGRFSRRDFGQMTRREGIAVTGLGWLLVTGLGMLPFVFGRYTGLLDGIFESISGFTGTGGTIFTSLSQLPQSVLLWRSMTNWIGGLGIIVIFIALLPSTGPSALYMYAAEGAWPGNRILPKLRDMAMVLFRLYLVLTLTAMWIYMLCGMDVLTALNHAFSTLGTGGFSTFDDSVGHFYNAEIEGWIGLFMVIGGGNFALYYRAYRKGPGTLLHDTEFRVYVLMLVVACMLIAADLVVERGMGVTTALRYGSFQVASLSNTGFVSTDYDTWPSFAKGILLLLMLPGGCAGSTASGIKVARFVMLYQLVRTQLAERLQPHRVMAVVVKGTEVSRKALTRVGQFFFLYMMCIVIESLALTALGIPVFDAVGLSVTTVGNVGPAFGIVGATQTYALLSSSVKAVLCVAMLLGRLEIFTLLVMLRPSFWRQAKW